jgi:hypothetical protein
VQIKMLKNMIAPALAGLAAASGAAQTSGDVGALNSHKVVQTAAEALTQDAREYARTTGLTVDEALRRLGAQQETVSVTDALRATYSDRLAGISIEHRPEYRIMVLLTGSEPVVDRSIIAGGMTVPIVFRTGAAATYDQLLESMTRHQAAIAQRYPRMRGLGVDPRTGEIVLMVQDASLYGGAEAMEAEAEALTGSPVRIRELAGEDGNSSIEGGARVEGVDPADGRRYACTTGFVVTDGARHGIVTAAHCPDTLTYYAPGGGQTPLDFVGQWGARYQDVQVHVADLPLEPVFYADTAKRTARRVTSWRNRTSTRAGDVVCRRGETTGYSCSEVELVNFAPPGDLCGGPCDPLWVTVAGPSCRSGDSGGPIFIGTVAFGIVKGGNYGRTGRCNFYYYMSTDYLPEGWSLLYR